MPWSTIEGYALIKALAMGLVTAAVGTTFFQSVVIALISGSLGVLGMIVSARIAAKEARINRSKLEGIDRKMDRRREEYSDNDS